MTRNRTQAVVFVALVACCASSAAAQDVRDPATRPLNALSGFDPASLTGFRDRPLFSPSRRAVAQVAASQEASAGTDRKAPNIRVVGVIDTPDGSIAHIADNDTGASATLRAGDVFRDWTVDVVGVSGIAMSNDGRTSTYAIFASSTSGSAGISTVATTASDPEDLREPKEVRVITLSSKETAEQSQADAAQETQDLLDVFGKKAKPAD